MITQAELKAALDYDPETGLFTWHYRSQEHFKSFRAYKAWNGQYGGKVAGTNNGHGYTAININREINLAHRLAWLYVYGHFPELSLDHINGVRDDNRISNLRECNQSQNTQNQRKAKSNNKSGLLGVRTFQNGMFGASINHKHLGYFKTKEEAYECYLKAKREVHEFNTI